MNLVPLKRKQTADYNIGPTKKVKVHNNFIGGLLVVGDKIISVSEDGSLKLCQADSLKLIKTLIQLSYPINYLALSDDHSLIAAASDDGKIRILSTENWRIIHEINAHSSYVTKLVFNKDTLISISKDETIKIWDPLKAELLEELKGHEAWVYTLCASPDGKKLLTTANSCSAVVWDLKNKSMEKELVKGGRLIYGNDGTTLLLGGNNTSDIGNKFFPNCSLWIKGNMAFTCSQDIVCWNTKDWTVKWQEDISYENVRAVLHLPHYNMLIAVSNNIYGISPETGKTVFSQKNTDSTAFTSAALLGDDYLVTGDEKGNLAIWNLAEIAAAGQKAPFSGDVYKPLYVPAAERIIAGSWLGGIISIWSKNGRFMASFKGLDANTDNQPIGILPKEPAKVLMTGEGEIWVVDVSTAKIDRKLVMDHKELKVTDAFWINDIEFIASCVNALPRLVNVESGKIKVIQSNFSLGGQNIKLDDERCLYQLSYYKDENYYKTDAEISEISLFVGKDKSLKTLEKQAPLVVYNLKTNTIEQEWWFPNAQLKSDWGQYGWPINGGPENKLVAATYTDEKQILIWKVGESKPITIKDLTPMARSKYSSPYPVFANEKVFIFRLDDDFLKYDISTGNWESIFTDGWKTALSPDKRFIANIQGRNKLVIFDTISWQKVCSVPVGFEMEWVLMTEELLYTYSKTNGLVLFRIEL